MEPWYPTKHCSKCSKHTNSFSPNTNTHQVGSVIKMLERLGRSSVEELVLSICKALD